MKRSDFLKNVFGAAVVAAMPPLVVKQIDALPETEIKSEKEIVTPENIETALLCDVFYLYDNKEIIAYSHLFNFSLRRDTVPIQECSMDSDNWQHYISGDTYVGIDNMIIKNIHSLDLCKSYHFLAINDDLDWKMYGDVYITKCEQTKTNHYNVELILAGAMSIEDLTKEEDESTNTPSTT
jgi:hypothetical protein